MSGNQSILQYHALLHHDEVITLSSSLRPHQVEKGASLMVQWQRICLQCRRHWLDPWVRRSLAEGNSNPLQYSHLGNPMDR